jgi:DNA gyrase subunit A
VKSARVVGDVMGNFHPHGDQSIYDALVRLGQGFSLRHPLIDPHGNFGTPADPPAAMRYTECRLDNLAMRMLDGIDEDTVNFSPNFDATNEEPEVLPSRFPNLLVNGSQGIAVGMATNIPPHNLGEVVDAVIHVLHHPEATTDDLMAFVKGPDFPTGGIIMGRQGINEAYRTGRGSIKVRARAEIDESGGSAHIVVTELAYQTSVESIEEKTAELVERHEIEGIRAVRNESANGKTRLVFELKRDAPALVILNNLYKHTPLQTSFPVNMVALIDGVPRTLSLRDAIGAYVEHQIEVLVRRSQFRLDKAEARLHVVEGLLKAVDLIDEIIATIRASADRTEARAALMGESFEFSEIQANEILDMQLGRLTRLGRDSLNEEADELRSRIAELQAILTDDARLRGVIAEELSAVRDDFANPRRTELAHDVGDLAIEDLIDDEELVFTLSARGYVKTVAADEFRIQGRGGRGITGAALKDEDYVVQLLHTSAHAYLLFFTSFGRVYRLKAHEVPMAGRTARGTNIVNLLQLQPDERIAAVIDTRDYETFHNLLFVTRNGTVKKTRFTEYDKSRRDGLIALVLRDGDELVSVLPTTGHDDLCLVSRSGRLMRFQEDQVRAMGRAAGGVRGMRLLADDAVVSCVPVREGMNLLVVTDAGYGKRTELSAFAPKGRGGQGVTAIKLTSDKGAVVAALAVTDDAHVMMVASNGVVIRMPVASISMQGPYATGVKVMAVPDDQRVAAVAPVFQNGDTTDADSSGDEAGTEEPGGPEAGGPGADDPGDTVTDAG